MSVDLDFSINPLDINNITSKGDEIFGFSIHASTEV